MLITFDWELLHNFWHRFLSLSFFLVSVPIIVFFYWKKKVNFCKARLPFLQINILVIFLMGTCLKHSRFWKLKCPQLLIKIILTTFEHIFGIITSYFLTHSNLRNIKAGKISPFIHKSIHPHNKGFGTKTSRRLLLQNWNFNFHSWYDNNNWKEKWIGPL